MDREELNETLDLMADEASAIIQAQRVLAGIHEELRKNAISPFEQDFIYEEYFGQRPSEPQQIEINGVIITTIVLHQTGIGLRDIKGADLLYEIEDEKYALILFKRANPKTGFVQNDSNQLDAFLNNCPDVCMYKRKTSKWWPVRLNGYCGCWYRVDYAGKTYYVHGCEAKNTYGARGSTNISEFSTGISRKTFLELFALCRIGALTRISPPDNCVSILLEHQHIVFKVSQRGRWHNPE